LSPSATCRGPALAKIIDCTGLHILPGVVDSQVHFREPGLEHKEDLESGSRAAVLGGVTTVFEMPNTKPLTTSAEALADKVARATNRMHCDFAFWVGGTRENARDVGELERLPGAAGIKVFMGSSTGDLLVEDDEGVFLDPEKHAPTRRLSFRGRVPVAGPNGRTRDGRSGVASGMARRDRRTSVHRAAGEYCPAGPRPHPCAAHLDRRRDRLS
jgi:dihydroorotase-like cyclic amidohydrolase